MNFIFAREKDGRAHFKVKHPEVTEKEVKELFQRKMIIQPSYEDTIKGIGYTQEKRFLVVVYKILKRKNIMLIITVYPAKKKHIFEYAKLIKEV